MVLLKGKGKGEEVAQGGIASLDDKKLGRAIEYIIGYKPPELDSSTTGFQGTTPSASAPGAFTDSSWAARKDDRSRFLLPGGDIDFQELASYLDTRLNAIAAGDTGNMEEDGPTRGRRQGGPASGTPGRTEAPRVGAEDDSTPARPLTHEELVRLGKIGPPTVLMPRSGFTGEIRIQRLGFDWQGWPIEEEVEGGSAASGPSGAAGAGAPGVHQQGSQGADMAVDVDDAAGSGAAAGPSMESLLPQAGGVIAGGVPVPGPSEAASGAEAAAAAAAGDETMSEAAASGPASSDDAMGEAAGAGAGERESVAAGSGSSGVGTLPMETEADAVAATGADAEGEHDDAPGVNTGAGEHAGTGEGAGERERDGPGEEDEAGGAVAGAGATAGPSGVRRGRPVFSAGLALESLGNFSSARANACVYKGRWMFEATLGTPGIQQIGWATLQCPFTNEEGVGDAPDSYAYDGKRVRKWHVGSERYGEHWLVGDVIGCCIDVDKGEIEFFQNGNSLGVAFKGVRRWDRGLGYFPAVSLSLGERCELNFGGRPFRFPVTAYLPLQAPPEGLYFGPPGEEGREAPVPSSAALKSSATGAGEGDGGAVRQGGGGAGGGLRLFGGAEEQAVYLLSCLRRLVLEKWADLPVVHRETAEVRPAAAGGNLLFASRLKGKVGRPSKDEYALIASTVCDRLCPLLLQGGQQVEVWRSPDGAPQLLSEAHSPQEQQRVAQMGPPGRYLRGGYVVWAALVPFLMSLYGEREPHTVRKLDRLLDLLLLFLEKHEHRAVFPAVMDCLAYHSATTGLARETLPWSGSYPYLALACQLAKRKDILLAWYEAPGFMDGLESLLTRKGGNERERAKLLPAVWWPGCREAEEGCTEVQWRQQTALLTESLQKVSAGPFRANGSGVVN